MNDWILNIEFKKLVVNHARKWIDDAYPLRPAMFCDLQHSDQVRLWGESKGFDEGVAACQKAVNEWLAELTRGTGAK